MKPWRRTPIAFAVVVLLSGGCSNDDTVVQPSDEILNPNAPNANARVVLEATFGDPRRVSILKQLEPDGLGGFYFYGVLDSATVVGRLDDTGRLLWRSETAYSVRDLQVLSPPSNSLLAVGGQDIDGDELSDAGYVTLYSAIGTPLSQLVYSSSGSSVWFNAVANLTDTTFVIAGGERTATTLTPVAATIARPSPGTLEKRQQLAIASLPGRFFDNVVTDPSTLLVGSDIVFYALSDMGSITSTISVHKIRAAAELSSATVEWSESIVTDPGLGTFAGPGEYLALVHDNLYIIGWAHSEKNRLPNDIGYWRDCLAASVATDGTLRWVTDVQITQHNEQFLGMYISEDGMYASGICAGFFESDQALGYGLISRVRLDDGKVLWNMTVGDRASRSTFQDVFVAGELAYGIGSTRYEVRSGGFLGWFAQLDVTDPPLSPVAPRIVAGPGGVGGSARGPFVDDDR